MMATDPIQLATLLKAAADPLRLQILKVLGDSSYGVLELSMIFDLRQSGMSHHLKVLATAGWVETRREGNSIFYRRALPSGPFQAVQEQVFTEADQLQIPDELQRRMDAVHDERYQIAQEFFDRNADRFAEQQDLIAAFETYGEIASGLLRNKLNGQPQLAIEIGPGRGEFLSSLSQQFSQVVAADISGDMLEQAAQHCQQQKLSNIELRQSDSRQLSDLAEHADAVVYNMVLHHVPDPAEEFRQSAKLLRDGGYLLVSDLCQHDQDWAHKNCGDLWLGFDEQELQRWASHAGLNPIQTTYVGLRNGFQIQCQLFQKTEPTT